MERDKKRRICEYCEESVSKTNFYLKHRNGNCSKKKKKPSESRSSAESINEDCIFYGNNKTATGNNRKQQLNQFVPLSDIIEENSNKGNEFYIVFGICL